MEIEVVGKHIDITDAIKQYAHDKASKLSKYYDRVSTVQVLADKRDNHTYEIEMIVSVDKSAPFIATAAHEDLYACIDDCESKIERQLHDHKEKLRNRKHQAS